MIRTISSITYHPINRALGFLFLFSLLPSPRKYSSKKTYRRNREREEIFANKEVYSSIERKEKKKGENVWTRCDRRTTMSRVWHSISTISRANDVIIIERMRVYVEKGLRRYEWRTLLQGNSENTSMGWRNDQFHAASSCLHLIIGEIPIYTFESCSYNN